MLPDKEIGELRSRHSVELKNLYRDHDVIAHARVKRLRWAGHVKRREHGTLFGEG
jgi:hypothetical protein